LPAAMRLKEKYGVDMPLIEKVDGVVNETITVEQAVCDLMTRSQKPELPPKAFEKQY
jgi:glycerol-3-phosphate dehydrogenase